eukprot:7006800-Prymnesium_polylepis.2
MPMKPVAVPHAAASTRQTFSSGRYAAGYMAISRLIAILRASLLSFSCFGFAGDGAVFAPPFSCGSSCVGAARAAAGTAASCSDTCWTLTASAFTSTTSPALAMGASPPIASASACDSCSCLAASLCSLPSFLASSASYEPVSTTSPL